MEIEENMDNHIFFELLSDMIFIHVTHRHSKKSGSIGLEIRPV